MPWQNAGTPIQALGLVERTGFDARTASRPANTQTVLNNVSLDIDGAGLTAIVGPSGAGKTSLLYVLSGLDRPDSGRVTIGGTDVYALNEERRSRFIRGHIGFVFQQYNLVPYLTVEENVMLPLSLAHRKADYVQVTQLLSRFGLRQRAKTTVSALSGGEQQRVALCRALLMRPAVVFADEPTGALDTANSELVLQVLRELADAGSSVVMVTHDTDAAALADHVIFLRDGQVTHIAGRLTAEQIADGIRRTFVPAGSPPLVAPARSVGPMMVNAQPIQSVQPGRPVQRVAYPQQRKEAHRG